MFQIIILNLLLTLPTLAQAQTPIPRQGDSWPTGTYKSGDYCKWRTAVAGTFSSWGIRLLFCYLLRILSKIAPAHPGKYKIAACRAKSGKCSTIASAMLGGTPTRGFNVMNHPHLRR
jgi:hypothetical protein